MKKKMRTKFTGREVEALLDTVEYTWEYLPEDTPPADGLVDPETILWVKSELEHGNYAAWFVAHVTAKVEVDDMEITAEDYLGECSYRSFAEFRESPVSADIELHVKCLLRDKLQTLIK